MPLLENQKESIQEIVELFIPELPKEKEELKKIINDFKDAFANKLDAIHELAHLQNFIQDPFNKYQRFQELNPGITREDVIAYICELITNYFSKAATTLGCALNDFNWDKTLILASVPQLEGWPDFHFNFSPEDKIYFFKAHVLFKEKLIKIDHGFRHAEGSTFYDHTQNSFDDDFYEEVGKRFLARQPIGTILKEVIEKIFVVDEVCRPGGLREAMSEVLIEVNPFFKDHTSRDMRPVFDLLQDEFYFKLAEKGILDEWEFSGLEDNQVNFLISPNAKWLQTEEYYRFLDLKRLPDCKLKLITHHYYFNVLKQSENKKSLKDFFASLDFEAAELFLNPIIVNLLSANKVTLQDVREFDGDASKILCEPLYQKLFAEKQLPFALLKSEESIRCLQDPTLVGLLRDKIIEPSRINTLENIRQILANKFATMYIKIISCKKAALQNEIKSLSKEDQFFDILIAECKENLKENYTHQRSLHDSIIQTLIPRKGTWAETINSIIEKVIKNEERKSEWETNKRQKCNSYFFKKKPLSSQPLIEKLVELNNSFNVHHLTKKRKLRA